MSEKPADSARTEARHAIAFLAENLEACVEIGHWSLEDVREQLFSIVALLDRPDA